MTSIKTSMGAIADHHMMPVAKTDNTKDKAAATFHDRDRGTIFAHKAIGLCMAQQSDWNRLAHNLFTLNREARDKAMGVWAAWIKERKAEMSAVHETLEKKQLSKVLNTATARISNMRVINKAINSGMDYQTLAEKMHCSLQDTANLSIDSILVVARALIPSETRGRPAKTMLERLADFVANAEKTEPTGFDREVLEQIAKLQADLNRIAAKHADAAAPF